MEGIAWFNKSRRAHTVDDFETWVEGGSTPTLNTSDNTDVRTNTVVVFSVREDATANNFHATELTVINTLQSHQPSVQSHHSQPFVVEIGDVMDKSVLIRMRSGKPGGGKGALVSEEKSLTLATSNDQTLITPAVVRRLTPTECERLQGFPDGWTAGQLDSHRYKQMGNAVTVNVAAAVGAFIMQSEMETE